MKNFFIIHNEDKKYTGETIKAIETLLKERNCNVTLNDSNKATRPYLYTNPNSIPNNTDCIISVGGDGTLIRAARDTVDLGIPIIGVNTGHLGFLAEVEIDKLKEAVEKLISDEFHIENRMRLSVGGFNNGLNIKDSALNDIVFLKKSHFGVLGINVYVNHQHLNTYNADGVIISTPTGSTGYSLSAGGPMVDPSTDLIVITPICPHTINARPVVLSGSSHIEVRLNQASIEKNIMAMVICDGEQIDVLKDNGFLQINSSLAVTRIIKLNSLNFIKTLRNKMKDE